MSRNNNAALRDRVAIVTGASSGIGAATAIRLAREGLKVVLSARRAERLEQIASEITTQGGTACPFTADLSEENAPQALINFTRDQFGRVDVLVNNAGSFWYGYAAEQPWETARKMLRLDVEAVLHLTLGVLPEMLARDSGHIITVGSIAGDIPSQGIALYGGTKAFLTNFFSALNRELRGTRVRACLIKPGAVDTEFFARGAERPGSQYLGMERLGVSAERVAEAIWSVIVKPRRVVYVPGIMALTPWFELIFGGIIDHLGPVLLRRHDRISHHRRDAHASNG